MTLLIPGLLKKPGQVGVREKVLMFSVSGRSTVGAIFNSVDLTCGQTFRCATNAIGGTGLLEKGKRGGLGDRGAGRLSYGDLREGEAIVLMAKGIRILSDKTIGRWAVKTVKAKTWLRKNRALGKTETGEEKAVNVCERSYNEALATGGEGDRGYREKVGTGYINKEAI